MRRKMRERDMEKRKDMNNKTRVKKEPDIPWGRLVPQCSGRHVPEPH